MHDKHCNKIKNLFLKMVDRQQQPLSVDQYIYSYEENEAPLQVQRQNPKNPTTNRFEQRRIIEQQV